MQIAVFRVDAVRNSVKSNFKMSLKIKSKTRHVRNRPPINIFGYFALKIKNGLTTKKKLKRLLCTYSILFHQK